MEKPVIWLPLEVGYKEKKQLVFIPDSGDKKETQDLIEWQTEATISQLKKQPARKRVYSKQESAKALKDYINWWNQYKRQGTKQYF